MGFSEMIEQLSFGKTVPRLDTCLGLYVSPEVMFLAEVELGGGKPKVTHLVRLPMPAPATGAGSKTVGSLNTEFLGDVERVGGVLAKAMSEIRWKSKHVMVTLSHHLGILRYFTLPAIDRRFWKTAIPAEAKKYIPIPFASLSHDFQVTGAQGDRRGRQGVLFGVTDRRNLANVSALVEKAGLQLMGVELAPCSVERLWDTLDGGGTYAQVHFDQGEIRILLSEAGVPIFFREVFLGADASALDRRKVDLSGCIDFSRKQLGFSGPERLRVSGQVADLEAWRQAFSQDVGQQASIMEIDKLLGLRGGQWGGYAAIGTALRYLLPTPLELDLGAVGKISEEDRRAARTILTASALAAACFILVGSIRLGLLYHKSAELNSLKKVVSIIDAFKGKTGSDIERLIAGMQDKVNAFGALTMRQVPLTYVLAAVAEVIPDPVWVTGLSYDNPLSLGGGASRSVRTMTIAGHTMGATRAVEQDLAFRFTESLRSHEKFKEAFPSIEQSVEAPNKEQDSTAVQEGPDDERNRTRYSIKCSSIKT